MNYLDEVFGVKKLFRLYISMCLLALLSACGGGGGSGGTPAFSGSGGTTGTTPGTTSNGTVAVSLLDSSGNASNSLSSTGQLTAKALVINATGVPVANALVIFTLSDATKAIMVPNTALTNSAGIAQITLQGGTTNGAAALTASVILAGSTITGGANFQMSGALGSANGIVAVSLFDASGAQSTSISGAGFLTAKVSVTDSKGAPVASAVVTFTLSNAAVATMLPSSALTDSSGVAQITLKGGTVDGATSLTATALVTGTQVSGSASFSVKSVSGGSNGGVKLALLDSGTTSSIITATNTLTAKATVTDSQGAPAANTLVTFTLGNGSFATMMPFSGTTVTDSSGIAQISLKAGSVPGATTVTVTTSVVAGILISDSSPINVISIPNVSNGAIAIRLFDINGVPNNTISGFTPLTAKATIVDALGAPLPNALVTFALSNASIATMTPSAGTAITDSNGVAQISLKAGTSTGAVSVTATTSVNVGTTISASTNFSVTAVSGSPSGIVSISLLDGNGSPSTLISGSGTLNAKALVTNGQGTPVVNALVTFSVGNNTIASMVPSAGTAITDSTGVAQISLKAGGAAGATSVTATTAVVAGASISGAANFTVGAAAAAIPAAVNFVSAVPADKSIVIKGAGGSGRTEVALLIFKVVDSSNSGIANKQVDFTVQSTAPVTLIASSGMTDASGNVTATINSGSSPTTVRVNATVSGTTVSGVSDTLTVTTGQPVQGSFTLAREKINVEGIDVVGITNKITAYLADANGGVVADNTPIVFTTDSGAVVGDGGTSATARCVTVNGACSIVWRSQYPNKSLVTVSATATNATSTLNASTQFTNSASRGTVTENSSGIYNPWTAPISFSFPAATCTPQAFTIKAIDLNGYTMPQGTTLSLQDTSNVSITVFPPTVSAYANNAQTSTDHNITITPTALCPKGVGHSYLQLTTPSGALQSYRIDIVYPG